MRASLAAFVIGAALAASAPSSFGAERAGRVLIAAGEVTILRDGQRIPAQGGTEVQSGDTVQLGAASNAQLLLTDNSIVALRSDTTFRIADYHYTGTSAPGERSFLALLKGGMRTLTGIIGHLRHDEYHVTTPTATIGIRGTNYALVQCDNDCRNPDGTLAANGTYGAITDGRIAVTNKTGEHVFGANQFFSVQSETALPKQLIGPPPFLQDTLQGRGRAKGAVAQAPGAPKEGGGSESQGTSAQSGQGGGTGDTSVTSSTTSAAPPVVLTQTVTPVTNAAAVSGPGAIVQPTTPTGTQFYRVSGTLNIPVNCSNPPCVSIAQGTFILGVNYDQKRVTFASAFETDQGVVFNIRSPFEGFPVTISNGVATFDGSSSTVGGGARCSQCGSGGTAGNLLSMGISGTVSGGTASITLNAVTPVDSGSFPLTLTQFTPSTTAAGAIVTPTSGGGAVAFSNSLFGLTVDSSGKLTQIGPSLGYLQNNVGSATNTILGSAPAAGNLVWGTWSGGGAQVTDFNYASFTTASTGPQSVQPWITGTTTAVLPSTGSVTYTPIGWIVNNGYGTLNHASLTADFVNLMMSVSLNATNVAFGNTFQMDGSSGISPTNSRFGGAFSTVTCTGPCASGTPGGSFGGFFAGPNAEGAGLTFTAGYASNNGVSGAVAFAQPGVASPTTVYYELINATVPFSCNGTPCGTAQLGDVILAINLSTQRATVRADLAVVDQNGTTVGFVNAGTPFNLGGIPVTVNNGTISFSATINRSDFPTQNGAFGCFNCDSASASGPAAGFLDTVTVSGTVTGSQANLTLSGSSDIGGVGSFSATLQQASLSNQLAAAMVIAGLPTGGPSVAVSNAYGFVHTGGAGQLTSFGTQIGEPYANVGSSNNTIVGSAPAAGHLVWGYWSGGGANITSVDYSSYITPSTGPRSYVPWITTSNLTGTLPTMSGTYTFTPIGWTVPGGNTFNSGSLTADFVNREVGISLNATNTVLGNTFQMDGSSGINAAGSPRFGAAFSNVTCTGPCGGTPGGNFAGFFAGPNAEGAGVSFEAGFGVPGQGVDGAVAFAQPSAMPLPSSGTVYYRLTGAVLPTTCGGSPCGTVDVGDMTLAVNLTTKRAGIVADLVATGGVSGNTAAIINAGTPFNLGGIPITVNNGTITFSATVNRSDFPTQNGAFRCFNCDSASASTPTAGFLDSISVSGTITGVQAQLTLSGTSNTGGTGTFNATLIPATPPNQLAAATVLPANPTSGGPTVAFSSAYWGVQTDSSQRLTDFGTLLGEPSAHVGTATNTIVGSDASAGNLVWGSWTGSGAAIVPYDYQAYTTPASGAGSYVPWITGNVTPGSALPTSLGTATFTPIGWTVDGSGQFNSGSLTADFVNRQVSITLNATNTQFGNTFVGNGSSGIGVGSARFGGGMSSVTCTGPCGGSPGTAGGSFHGFFAGPNAEGAGVSFIMGGVGAGQGVYGAVAFKR